jgi:two-component system chemotaxis sensor kinase CheA
MAANDNFFNGFLDDYFAESEDHLNAATQTLLSLGAAIGHPVEERAAVDELFRFFHSLKAISAMVELRPAEQLAHHLEHYLRAIRDRELSLSATGVEVLVEGTRRLEHIITEYRFHRPLPGIDDVVGHVASMLGNSEDAVAPAATRGERSGDAAQRRWACTFTPSRELLAQGIGVDSVRKRLSDLGTIVAAAPQVRPDGSIAFRFTLETDAGVDAQEALRDAAVAVEPASVEPAAPVAEIYRGRRQGDDTATVAPSHVVRVDLTRLDELMRNIGDLVISRARLTDTLARVERHVPAGEWRAIQENASTIDRQLRALREGIMRVRLVPVGEIFRRMPFVVRDLARETGKRVTLHLHGQSTEIDKYLIERMMDPVLHLVRNAVTHGVETAAERTARGKPPEAAITLSASTAGEFVTIQVADDGHGVDAAAVMERAKTMGLPVAARGSDAASLLTLLCSPGFSTTDDVDRGSGRGVGMAVVKEIVEHLSGSISMDTTPGEGTRFTITLPLTLAITDALVAAVGSELFAIPQGAVREVISVPPAEVRTLEQNEIVPYRGGALPIVRLARVFDISVVSPTRVHVFVVGVGASAVGLAVDRIIGQREIVVRAFADPLLRVDGISGATDLGDGRVVLILDPAALARAARERTSVPFARSSRSAGLRAQGAL